MPFGIWENCKILSLLVRKSLVEGRIESVKILAVQMILGDADGVGKALIVNDLALTQILDGIADVGIVAQAQNVVVGHSRLLLCYYHVFATKLSLAKFRKILMLQGISALLELTIFQKFQ